MMAQDLLQLRTICPIKAQNAGLFISRGAAMHPTRIILSHELIFVKEGELDMWEEDHTFHLEAGQTLHLWPGRQHGSCVPMPPGLRFYWIHFELEPGAPDENGCLGEEASSLIDIPQVAQIPQPERLERLFRTFLEDQETGMLHPYAASLLITLMLTEVAQSQDERMVHPDDSNFVAVWANTYIRMNFDRPITASKVATALGYNSDYLGRIYRHVYGVTLTEAIHRQRIHKACQFLLNASLTVEQVASKCGFVDPDYFRRIFRRHMQISPGDYRTEASRVHVNTH